MLRFVAYLIICALTIAALRAGAPGILTAMVSAATIFLVIAGGRPPRGRRPIRAPRRHRPTVAEPVDPATVVIGDLNDPRWLRANDMPATAELIEANYAAKGIRLAQHPARTYPCGCSISPLTKGGYITVPCLQHKAAGGPPLTTAAVPTWSATRTEACGCRHHSSGHAHANNGDRVWEAVDPCPEHRRNQDALAQATAELDIMITDLRRSLDEALDRDHGQRWMGAR